MTDQKPYESHDPATNGGRQAAPDPAHEAGDTGQAAAQPGAAPGMPDAAERIIALANEIEQLKKDRLLALADAENATKRAERRISENAKYATANICKALLQVADNLGRALLAAPAEQRAANDALKNLAAGVDLTEKELLKVLEDQGVQKINALNQPFDPNLHNAVQEIENATVPSGTVVQVMLDGYVMHDRLLRPSMVMVSRGGPKREAIQADGAAQGVDTKV